MDKLKKWFKNPRNIVFIILMIAVTIYAIIDNALVELVIIYLVVALVGILVGSMINLANRLRK